jgi:hypothetical protein
MRDRVKILSVAMRVAIGGVFVFAALGKFLSIHDSGDDLFKAIVGESTAARVLVCLAEATLGGWLVAGVLPRASSIASMAVCSAFLRILLFKIQKPAPKECGCFGTKLTTTVGRARASLLRSMGLNLSIMSAAGFVLSSSGRRTNDRHHEAEDVDRSTSAAGVYAG